MYSLYSDSSFDNDDYSSDEQREPDYDHDDYSLSEPDFRDLDFNDYSVDEPNIILDVPYVPTAENVVEAMLDFGQVGRKDVLYDLGCGDGRIVVAAALKRKARGVGIDMDPARIADAMEYAGNTGVEFEVDFIEGDLLEVDIHEATVVTLYLLDEVNVMLRPRLLDELNPGTRIVSHAFDMGDWKPDDRHHYGKANLYKWIVPAKVAGMWEWQTTSGKTYRAELRQKYQEVGGKVWIDGAEAILKSALLRGDLLELVIKADSDSRPISFVMRCEKKQLFAAEESSKQATPAVRVSYSS